MLTAVNRTDRTEKAEKAEKADKTVKNFDPIKDANERGQALYNRIVALFSEVLLPRQNLQIQSSNDKCRTLLTIWKRYVEAAPHVEAIFLYLERYWLERQIKGKKAVQFVIPLMWHLWEEQIAGFDLLEEAAGEQWTLLRSNQQDDATLLRDIVGFYRQLTNLPADSYGTTCGAKSPSRAQLERLFPFYGRHLEQWIETDLLPRMLQKSSLLDRLDLLAQFAQEELALSKAIVFSEAECKQALQKILIEKVLLGGKLDVLHQLRVSFSMGDLAFAASEAKVFFSLFFLLAPSTASLSAVSQTIREGMEQRLAMAPVDITNLLLTFKESTLMIASFLGGSQNPLCSVPKETLALLLKGERSTEIAQALAQWCDLHLAQGLILEDLFQMLCLMPAEACKTFSKWHLRLVAKRLILSLASTDSSNGRMLEQQLFQQLRTLSGDKGPLLPLAGPMQHMLGDLEQSAKLSALFLAESSRKRSKPRKSLRLEVYTITEGVWPLSSRSPELSQSFESFKWPEEIASDLAAFTDFHASQRSKTRLFWHPLLTTAELLWDGRTLVVSAVHYALLSCLSQGPLDIGPISSSTGLSREQATRYLLDLLAAGLVLSSGSGYGLNPKQAEAEMPQTHYLDSLQIADQTVRSSNKRNRSLLAASQDEPHYKPDVIQDHLLLLQAAVIRVLKKLASSITLANLESLVGREVAGRVDLTTEGLMEKALAALLEKEYIACEKNLYSYKP